MSSEEEESEGESGFIRPTLLRQLRSILHEYPDDSQILKELIQNAEDAKAKEVRFLFCGASWGETDLFDPALARFQGPALYAYNDGRFDEQDWKGIRMIGKSVKENDTTKVGQFGRGFKSVFHITDFPSVESGGKILFMDPVKVGIKKETRFIDMKKDKDLIHAKAHQFSPLLETMPDLKRENDYTLFRFPLRTTTSKLSQKLYTKDKIKQLFESFEKEAEWNLLFLKSVETISLYWRESDSQEAALVFSVAAQSENLDEARQVRRRVREGISGDQSLQETYYLTMKAESHTSHTVRQSKWLISCGLQPLNDRPKHLKCRDARSYLSHVSVGVCLTPDLPREIAAGHIFCTLPVQRVKNESLTGLPIHVNGAFAMQQSRRDLQWPSADQAMSDPENLDLQAAWNRYLVVDTLPNVFTNALRRLIDDGTSSDVVYDVLPDTSDAGAIGYQWKRLAEGTVHQIMQTEVIEVLEQSRYNWYKLSDVRINSLDDPTADVVQKLMHTCGEKTARVPEHVLIHARNKGASEISASFVRSVLRKSLDCYKDFTLDEKMQLLEYVLQDVTPKTINELDGIQLLLCADDEFRRFQVGSKSATPIYLQSDLYSLELFPTSKDRLLHPNLPDSCDRKLKSITKQGKRINVAELDSKKSSELLKSAFPSNWTGKQHCQWLEGTPFTPAWFEQFWQTFQNDVDDLFIGWCLIPELEKPPCKLIAVQDRSVAICAKQANTRHKTDILDPMVQRACQALGAVVIQAQPDIIPQDAFEAFVNEPSCDGVVRTILALLEHDLLEPNLAKVKPEQYHSLRRYMAENCKCLDKRNVEVLRRLPMFPVLCYPQDDSLPRLVSPKECDIGADCKLDFRCPGTVLDLSEQSDRQLAQKLEVRVLTCSDLLQRRVIPQIKETLDGRSNFYTVEECDTILLTILEDPQIISCLTNDLSMLPFVSVGGAKRKCPGEVFDPTEQCLQLLLGHQKVFPDAGYENLSLCPSLKLLGLKDSSSVQACEIIENAKKVLVQTEDVALSIAKGIAQLVEKHPGVLSKQVGSSNLQRWLSGIKWCPVETKRPEGYPSSLQWHGEQHVTFESPLNLAHPNNDAVVGSVKGVPARGFISQAQWIEKKLFQEDPPSVETLMLHLKNIQRSYRPQEKVAFLSVILKTYAQLSTYTAGELSVIRKEYIDDDWVWHGEGFTSLSRAVREKPFTDLRPFVYVLPSEVEVTCGELFAKCSVSTSVDRTEALRRIATYFDRTITGSEDDVEGRALTIVLNILDDVSKTPDSYNKENLLVPVCNGARQNLRLRSIEECVFSDTSWKASEDEISSLEEKRIFLVHPRVPLNVCLRLDMQSLRKRELNASPIDLASEEFGQEEPLVQKLHNLIEEYADGFAIPKELLQNADDAGATTVSFVLDERTTDGPDKLLNEAMDDCQGPSLWVYNNAAFSEEDFRNIVKLGGRTKESMRDKIGCFGLGFNSVYNITDVPMFISRQYFVVFDPHKTHLGSLAQDKPGIRLEIPKIAHSIQRYCNQFRPFEGMFGCSVFDNQNFDFNGTLFRFPLRTTKQARKSDICGKVYTKDKVLSLFRKLLEEANDVLLFTKNVQEVKTYHIAQAVSPGEMQLLYRIKTAKAVYSETKNYCWSEMRQVSVDLESSMLDSTRLSCGSSQSNWIVVQKIGTKESRTIAQTNPSLLPVGGVAIPTDGAGQSGTETKTGTFFCFLPLPESTDMPLHINGSFAVASNRQGLVWHNRDSTEDVKRVWNTAVLVDPVCSSLISALEYFALKTRSESVYDFFPSADGDRPQNALGTRFYRQLLSEPRSHAIFTDGKTRKCLDSIVYLQSDFRTSEVGDIALEALRDCMQSVVPPQVVIDLPKHVLDGFRRSDMWETFSQTRQFTERGVLEKVLQSETIDASVRDKLVLHALTQNNKVLDDILRMLPCIPVSEDRTMKLKKPSALVEPKSRVGRLYDDSDLRFPFGKMFLEPTVFAHLRRLGMVADFETFSAIDLVERAKTVQNLIITDRRKALKRSYLVTECLTEKLRRGAEHSALGELRRIAFLPSIESSSKKPWISQPTKQSLGLHVPDDLFPVRHENLVCCVQSIVHPKCGRKKKKVPTATLR